MKKTYKVNLAIRFIEELWLSFYEYERLESEIECMKGDDPELDNIE